LRAWGLLIAGAVSPFLFSATLPVNVALALLLFSLPAAFSPRFRIFALFPLAFLYTTMAIDARIAERWPLSDSKTIVTLPGIVGSLPNISDDVVRFTFFPDDPGNLYPKKIRVYWYRDRSIKDGAEAVLPQVRAGQRWRLQLDLRAARARVNFSGSDAERWYFTDGIGALGYVQHGSNVLLAPAERFDLQHWRQAVYDKLNEKAGIAPGFRMLTALAIADRRGLLESDRDILSATGTGHLLAISGLHVGLAAMMGFYIGRLAGLLSGVSTKQRFALVLPYLGAWLAALGYSALSGFGVSTQRALLMLTVATAVLISRRSVQPMLAWLIAMVLVLAVDPFAPLRAGFWFSFVAVAVLISLFSPRQGQIPVWRRMLLAQAGISIVMAPLGMYWFQQVSFPGLLANLVAIPVVSMVIVPLILVSLPLLWLPGQLAGWLLGGAGWVTQALFVLLEWLSHIQPSALSATRTPGLAVTLLAMLGAFVVLLPRGVPLRFSGLLLMLPMVLISAQNPGPQETRVDVLDVGQGLAVLLSTQDFLMIYDTGPGNGRAGEGGWDLVDGSIRPMINASGTDPDLVVASHGDLDHAGGLNRLLKAYPGARFMANLPENHAGLDDCRAERSWRSGHLAFEILHPSGGLPYLGNDSSCVISVRSAGMSILLSGDISRTVERRLVDQGLQPHDVITVPHHGSSTSSSVAFIQAARPSWALVSAAMNNRFDFPRADVMKRYAQAHVPVLNTAGCGGIRLTGRADGSIMAESARVVRKAVWRWPADVGCPPAH